MALMRCKIRLHSGFDFFLAFWHGLRHLVHDTMSQGGRILRSLTRIGYPKANEFEADTLEWLFDCESVVPFLEWLSENIHETNVLSAEDLKR